MSLRNFPAYLNQRFQPLVMLLFVILFVSVSRVANASAEFGESFDWVNWILGSLACISFFFRLRVMDEIKDKKIDQSIHPERLVVQGKIQIKELVGIAMLGLVVEAIWSYYQGWTCLYIWMFTCGYSLLMRYEFFVSKWLEPRLFLYAFSHTLIMPWVVLWIASASLPVSGLFEPPIIALAIIAFFAALAFEVARKTYAKEEEPAQIMTYSKKFGRRGAAVLASLFLVLTSIGLAYLFAKFQIDYVFLILPLVGFLGTLFVYRKAIHADEAESFRTAEKLVSLVMLMNYLLLIVLL